MKARWTMIMPLTGLKLPGLNPRERMHWAIRRKLNKQCLKLIEAAWMTICEYEGLPPARYRAINVRRKVTVTRCWPRELDPDNLPSCVKPLMDALEHFSLIVDDSPTWIDLTVKQERAMKGDWQGFVIEITEDKP